MQPASPSNNYHYNKTLQKFASELRKNGTKAEACIWKHILKAGKLKTYNFRRQRPILNYIVDFVCVNLMLIIEVDGYSHLHLDVMKKDRIRQKDLENIGFTIIRFIDKEVLKEINNVEKVLETFIDNFERNS